MEVVIILMEMIKNFVEVVINLAEMVINFVEVFKNFAEMVINLSEMVRRVAGRIWGIIGVRIVWRRLKTEPWEQRAAIALSTAWW